MSNNPSDQPWPGPEQTDGPYGGPPPASPPPPVARQLVRDPFTKLGGVASGISHHYGVDVSLVRLAFVLFTLFTGFGLVFYALAWLIIPRAQFWPPVGGRGPTKPLTAREIGIGLLLIGAIVALFVNGGPFSQVLTPLILIAGGVWLLTQNPGPSPTSVPGPTPAPPTASGSATGPMPFSTDPGGASTIQDPIGPTLGATPPGTPVPPRSRRRKAVVLTFLGVVLLIPVLIIGGIVTAITFGDFDTDAGFSATYQPATIEAIPEEIRHDQGEIVLDLTQLEDSTFDEPVEVEIDLDLGAVEVIVPESMEVSVDAEAGLGQVTVFDRSVDGINPSTAIVTDDAEVVLDISVGVGDVSVQHPEG